MGVFNKVYLGFPEVFWEQDRDLIARYSAQQNLWPSIFNLYKQYGDKALIAISTAQDAVEVEAKTDDEIVIELMAILKEQYGDQIPQPNDVRITRWHQDPFSFGSYSFMKVGATEQSRVDLAATVDNKVYFAGEATSSRFPSTVHGALLSGLREAAKIR
jgi:monoamine oxidase